MKTRKQTGSRRYPFLGLTADGLKFKAALLDRPLCGIVPMKSAKCNGQTVDDSICLVRAYTTGTLWTVRVLSMPLLPC